MKKIIFLFIFCIFILTIFTSIKAQEVDINFTSNLTGEVSGDIKVAISINRGVDKVYFKIEGDNFYKDYTAIKDDETHYHFFWPTYEMPDSDYKLIAIAIIGDTKFSRIYGSRTTNSEKMATTDTNQMVNTAPITNTSQTDADMPEKTVNAVASPNDTIAPAKTGTTSTNPTTTATSPKTETTNASPTTATTPSKTETTNINPTTTTTTTAPPKTETTKINPTVATTPEKTTSANTIPPDTIELAKTANADNTLAEECKKMGISQEACAEFLTFPPECQKNNFIDREKCKKFLALPQECRENGIITEEECAKYTLLPQKCKDAKILNVENCNIFLTSPREIIQECRDIGIKTFEQCDLFLRLPKKCWEKKMTEEECKEFMSINPECREKGISNDGDCKKLLKIPSECRKEGIINKTECEQFIYKKSLPKECVDKGITTIEECNKFTFLKKLPEECKKADVSTEEECNKILSAQTQAILPQECQDANIIELEKCEIYMRENVLSEECKKVNATTKEECNKIMESLNLPEECKKQGITKKEECDLYLIKKHISNECQNTNIKTQAECDIFMFNKYSPEECRQAGIEKEDECKNFLANKYTKQIKCEGLDEWQCRESIKENHLGDIAAKETQFKEIKENVAHFFGETMEVSKLEKKIELTKETIPVKKKEAKLRIIAATEGTILNKNDILIKTSPIALMFDTDSDGLTDDMEKRMGTDPKNPDSDGDGYTDGTEVKVKYNPLGAGKKDTITSPIDQAILENKTLGQPKTDGEFSKELTIKPVKNIENEKKENQGYALSGSAEPNTVISLYIYSDLPLIVTTETDEFGNWQYELTESLIDGEHEIYVAINDNTGNVVKKSNPVSLFIQEAKAITAQDFVAAAPALASENAIIKTSAANSESLIKYYIIIAIAIVAIGIMLFIIFLIQKKKQQV